MTNAKAHGPFGVKKRFVFVLACLLLWAPAQATYKAKKPVAVESPTFESPQQERLYRLRQGEILTDGGHLKKGVWAVMDGVVEAPPEVVWRLFIYANDWKRYGLPDLIDCRAVDENVLKQVKDKKKAEDFYAALGGRVIDPVATRQSRAKWSNYTFQYYDMPWPVSDKWFIIQNSADETRSAEGAFKTTWENRAGNVRTMKGRLTIEPFEGDEKRTLLHYRVEVDPGSALPRFLLKYGVKKSLPSAMRVIRRESIRLRDKPAPLLKTQ